MAVRERRHGRVDADLAAVGGGEEGGRVHLPYAFAAWPCAWVCMIIHHARICHVHDVAVCICAWQIVFLEVVRRLPLPAFGRW